MLLVICIVNTSAHVTAIKALNYKFFIYLISKFHLCRANRGHVNCCARQLFCDSCTFVNAQTTSQPHIRTNCQCVIVLPVLPETQKWTFRAQEPSLLFNQYRSGCLGYEAQEHINSKTSDSLRKLNTRINDEKTESFPFFFKIST